MSHELLYTSAEHGLKPGSYGFCTVMATDGLSKALQDRLESLSGYEHPFAVTDSRASLNPVNYSYLIVTVANQRLHLLSRIADAGADYSGRSNKLAHHICLRPTELPAASPATAIAAPGLCITSFDGTPRTLPHRVLPQVAPRPLSICTAWEAVAGDAGLAGYLVQQTLQNPLRPITLIYSPGCDVLSLVVEAMSLLPTELQWRTTFSTFFTKLPAGVDCQWRFVLDGTSAADQARRNLQSPPIDLTYSRAVPSEGPFVEAARSGEKPIPEAVTSATSATMGSPSTGAISTEGGDSETYRLGTISSRPIRNNTSAGDDLFAKRGLSPWIWASIGGGALAVLLVMVVTVSMLVAPGPAPPEIASTEKPVAPPQVIEKPDLLVNSDPARKSTPTVNANVQPIVTSTNTNTETPQVVKNPIPNKPLTFEDATKDIRAKGTVLSLPKRDQGVAGSFGEQELCKLFVEHPADCELTLVTTETLGDGRPRMYLQREDASSDELQSWTAVTRVENKALATIEDVPIGRFELKNQTLYFQWGDAPAWTSPFGLLYCKLDVGIGSQKIQCSLTKPTIRVIEHLELDHRKASMPIDIAAGTLSSVKHLRYDLELIYDDWTDSRTSVKGDDSRMLKFEIPGDNKVGDTRIELEFQFVAPSATNDGAFNYRAYLYPTYLSDPKQKMEWERITKRNDQIAELETTREGFIVQDFENYRKHVADRRRKASMIWTPLEASLKQKTREFAKLSEEEKEKQQRALDDLRVKEQYSHEVVTFADETLLWVAAMEKQFKEMQKKLEVRFTIYLEFPGDSKFEQVVLVETNPPPSKRIPKSTSK